MLEITNPENRINNMPNISVIGVGGGGTNSIDRMIEAGLENISFIAMNTDYQVLETSKAPVKLQIGRKLTGGFGAGANPDVGKASAEESSEEIKAALDGSNMVILTCGLGGGTGTGAIPVIAQLCREKKILTVAVVTLPFSFEGLPKMKLATEGLEKLRDNVDTLLVIPNDKLLQLSDKPFFLEDAFTMADNVLRYTIEGITTIIFGKGMINLDFNDLKTTLSDKGLGHLGIGRVSKDDSIMDAVRQAIESPLLDTDISSAAHILLNTSGHINIMELNEAITYIREITSPDVDIMWGTVSNSDNPDEIIVTLIATGLNTPTADDLKDTQKEQSAQLHRNIPSAMQAAALSANSFNRTAGNSRNNGNSTLSASGSARNSNSVLSAAGNSPSGYIDYSGTNETPSAPVIPEFIRKYSPIPRKNK